MAIQGVPDTMLAARVIEFKKPYEIVQVQTPTSLEPQDMLIRVAVASYCHTDTMVLAGDLPTPLPCIASHEGAGTVAALGSGVSNFKVGDRVLCGIMYHRWGECLQCHGPENQLQYCQNLKSQLGVSGNGSFAEYQVVDSHEASVLPNNLSFESAAPLTCAGTSIWGALLKADLKQGQTIAIVGAGGGLGHLGIQFAKAQGLRVIGIDARDEGVQLAKDSGADLVLDARNDKEDVVAQAQHFTDGLGSHATINLSEVESAAPLAAAITRVHGVLVQVAQPKMVSLPWEELVFRDIRIHGSMGSSREEAQKMLRLCGEQDIRVKTVEFNGLNSLPKLVELAKSGKISGKSIVIIDQEAIRNQKKSGTKFI